MIQNFLGSQLTHSQSLSEWDVIHRKMKEKMTISQVKLYQRVKKSPNRSQYRHRSMSQKEKCFFQKGVLHIRRLQEKLNKPSIPLKIKQKNISKNIQGSNGINQLVIQKDINIVAYQLHPRKRQESCPSDENKVSCKKIYFINKQTFHRLSQKSRIKSGTTRKRSASTAEQNKTIQMKKNSRKSLKLLKKQQQKKLSMTLGQSLNIQKMKLVSENQNYEQYSQKSKRSQSCQYKKPFQSQQLQIKNKLKIDKRATTALLSTIKSRINGDSYKATQKPKLIL